MRKEVLLTRQEAAEILKVSPRTLIRWAKENVGPKPIDLRAGKGLRPTIRYPMSEIEKFLEVANPEGRS